MVHDLCPEKWVVQETDASCLNDPSHAPVSSWFVCRMIKVCCARKCFPVNIDVQLNSCYLSLEEKISIPISSID